MAKRTGFSATTERGARATSSRAAPRPSPARSEKKRTAKAIERPKRKAPAAAAEPARATASRRTVVRTPLLLTTATLPPRIPPPPPPLAPRSMELEWTGDPGDSSPPAEDAFDRWVRRGDELLRKLAEHGAANHEYRVDLREGRFYWVDPDGRVSAEARAELLCTYVPQTSSVTMGWADARLRGAASARIEGMPAELDDLDEEDAWHVAMGTADRTSADYLYRVRSPSCCLFLGLSGLTFTPTRVAFVPTTPVALVLATLSETRVAASLGAEPVDTLRARLTAAGASLMEQAEYAHRDTDWVARLVRTGRRLAALAERLPRPTFFSVAKGASTVWLEPKLATDLVESISLLEEEWGQFE